MLVEGDIIGHAKAADACRFTGRCNAPDGSTAFVCHVDRALSIDRRAHRPHNAGGQQGQCFAIQAHTIDFTYRAIWHDQRLRSSVESDTIYAILTLRGTRRARQIV